MAYTTVLLFVLLAPWLFTIWCALCLLRNYRLARTIGVPIIILIASPDNPVWILAHRIVLPIIEAIFGECDLTRYGYTEWVSQEANTKCMRSWGML